MPRQVWDKAAFDNNYRRDTEQRIMGPGQMVKYKVHYQRVVKRQDATVVATRLTNALALTGTESILIVGAGFGFLKEALVDDLGWTGNVVCIDSGAYVQAEKGETEEADVREIWDTYQKTWIEWAVGDDPQGYTGINKQVDTVEFDTPNPGQITVTFTDATGIVILRTVFDADIVLQGLDPDSGTGATLFNATFDGGTKARVPILDEDLSNNGSRNRVRNQNGGVDYDYAISERVIESLEDAECVTLSSNMHQVATNVVHLFEMFIPYKSTESEPNPWNWKWPDANEPLLPKWGQVDDFTNAQLAAEPWYTTNNWKALLPSDTFVKVGTYKVY